MSLLFIVSTPNGPRGWVEAIRETDPSIKVEVWPNVTDPQAVKFAAVWDQPHGELAKYPNLQCVSSLGAGVDHILRDTSKPAVPIVRIVDPYLVRDMTQYLIWAVLNHARSLDSYVYAQQKALWAPRIFQDLPQIGIMGIGQLGSDAAAKLTSLGFTVHAWSKSAKEISGITCFHGEAQMPEFLAQTDILICLLPLTAQTRHILNKQTFSQLKKGAYIINVARGAHLVEKDLLDALDNHTLSGVCLDVFETEPLPKEHPFWKHPAIKITPHIAAVTNRQSAAKQIVENYQRVLAGKPLLHVVNIERGY